MPDMQRHTIGWKCTSLVKGLVMTVDLTPPGAAGLHAVSCHSKIDRPSAQTMEDTAEEPVQVTAEQLGLQTGYAKSASFLRQLSADCLLSFARTTARTYTDDIDLQRCFRG